MMKKITSKELVVIPDGKGGEYSRFYVDVPAMQNEKTGEVFLGDDALRILDAFKVIGLCGYDIAGNALDGEIRRIKKNHIGAGRQRSRRCLQPA